MKKILAPSILAGNHANLVEALKITEDDGRSWIHLDIMDGHFVPNLSFGPQTVADLRKETEIFFDVHLMLDNPDLYIDSFIDAGADLITFHIEPDVDHRKIINQIKSRGKQVGIALNPATKFEAIVDLLNSESLDLVLCMTVNPGFGGQTFIYNVLDKVKKISEIRSKLSKQFQIEIDGGVCPEHVEESLDAGVDIFVAGTAYFKGNYEERKSFARSVGEKP